MLTRFALRAATVRALRGRTLVGRAVRDSEIAPIDDVAAEHPTPFIVVYTDDGKFTATGRDLFATSGDSRVDVGYQHLVIEIAVTQRMRIRGEDGEERDDVVHPALDAALEFNVDLIERQIMCALQAAEADSPWSEMWRQLVLDIGDRHSQRGSSMRDGVRFAGRQITLSVRLPREPAPGAPRAPIWQRFLTLAAADVDLAPLVPQLEAALAGTPQPEWAQIARTFGLSKGEAAALHLMPPGPPAAAPEEA